MGRGSQPAPRQTSPGQTPAAAPRGAETGTPASGESWLRRNAWPLALSAFFCLWNVVWLSIHDCPPMWDSAVHLTLSLEYRDAMAAGRADPAALLDISPFYPPLFYVMEAPLMALRPGPDTACLLHLPFLALLVFSVYRLGERFLHSRGAAALAAFIAGASPHVQWMSRDVMLDADVVALTAFLVLLASEPHAFTRTRRAVCLGVTAGLAMLFKWTVVFYAGPPIAWLAAATAMERWRSGGWEEVRPALSGMATALLAAVAVAWPWYLRNATYLVGQFLPTTQGLGPLEGDPGLWTLDGWTFYVRALMGWHLSLPLFALLVVAMFWLAKDRPPGCGVFLAWLWGPTLVFTTFANKAPRHLTPVVPAAAILVVWLLCRLGCRRARGAAFALCGGASLGLMGMASFGAPWLPQAPCLYQLDRPAFSQRSIQFAGGRPARSQILNTPDGWFLYNQEAFGVWGPPRRENWRVADILRLVSTAPPTGPGERNALGLIPDSTRLNVWNFRAYTRILKLSVDVGRIGTWSPGGAAFSPYRFVLLKDGDQGASWNTADNLRLMNDVIDHPERFAPMGRWALPDGSEASLYKNLSHRPDQRWKNPGKLFQ